MSATTHLSSSFGERALDFFDSLKAPKNLPRGVEVIYPFAHGETRRVMDVFYRTFFNDNYRRILVLGINPGRFGSGVTGVPFTDPVALEESCGISNSLMRRRELSSEFVYRFVREMGGVNEFYKHFFLSAVSPIGFTKNGRNYNYYDDQRFFEHIEPFLAKSLKKQSQLGTRRAVILLGTGKNQEYFARLVGAYKSFDWIRAVPHPRYVMQYHRKDLGTFLELYKKTFEEARSIAT